MGKVNDMGGRRSFVVEIQTGYAVLCSNILPLKYYALKTIILKNTGIKTNLEI